MTGEISVAEKTVAGREAMFVRLYKEAFPLLAKYVSRSGGSFDEAKDAFQDALVIFYEKGQAGTLDIKLTDKSYLLGIAKHLYIKRYGQQEKMQPIEAADMISDMQQPAPSVRNLLSFLETTGKKCMDLLQAFYYEKKPMIEIADAFGFSGTRSATVQKHKCIQKVRENIRQKSKTYDDFLD
ncbi:MAG: sigma-70 family RNA polymerase sigma factor [Sphingobacteriales bacterium]|nr:MAG: sigma-70 family RNA polymerase sigma factor [Sphingobacteriales bacterium]